MNVDFRTTPAGALAVLCAGMMLSLFSTAAVAQRGGFGIDPRAEDRTYHFTETGEDLPYCVFASSKVDDDTPAPLIIALHGAGVGPQIMCNSTAVGLAEEGGYILAAPMGYSPRGGYGVQRTGGGPGGNDADQPENLAELSERDVMNVLEMAREEFNVDEDRIYLTGHSMGGAGTYFLGSKHADIWAAIAPVAPAAFSMMQNRAEYLQPLKDAGVPIMVVHGDMDEAVPVQTSRDWVATMEELGIEHEYIELPGVTHGPVITVSQEYIYEFFGEHSK